MEASGSGLSVYASWNGATSVSRWRVLGGSSSTSLRSVKTAAKSGFETSIQVPSEAYVQVQALSSTGALLGSSQVLKG